MNLPNKLTVFRMCMVPVFLFLLCVPLPISETALRIITAVIFALTSITDMIDDDAVQPDPSLPGYRYHGCPVPPDCRRSRRRR